MLKNALAIGLLFFIPYGYAVGLLGPYLQNPSDNGIVVSWISHREKVPCTVQLNLPGEVRRFTARAFELTTLQDWWMNQATVSDLVPDTRYTYRLICDDREYGPHSLSTLPAPERGVSILLLSDHQNGALVQSTLKAVDAYSKINKIDLILFAGDLISHSNRPEDWFYREDGNGFFETFTRHHAILQNIPFFPAIGNHEISVDSKRDDARVQFEATTPENWSTLSYEELFTLPEMPVAVQKSRLESYRGKSITTGPEAFYAFRYGDTFIVSLFVARKWAAGDHTHRSGPSYERALDGDGRFIFEPVHVDSAQYAWFTSVMESDAARMARRRIVMLHHPVFSQGGNIFPSFGEPFDYKEDYLVEAYVPLFERYRVDLVLSGHNHIVNLFRKNNVYYLESSIIGSSYGPYRPLAGAAGSPEPHGLSAEVLIHGDDYSYFSVLNPDGVLYLVTVKEGKIIGETKLTSL